MKKQIDKKDLPPPMKQGDTLAPDYRVLRHIRRGDALDVYEVWSESRSCNCVAKTLCPHRVQDVKPRNRLLREGWLLKRTTHPHLVRVYETIREPVPIIIMETLVGATLGHLIKDANKCNKRLMCDELAILGQQLCSGLHYIHSLGTVHLDIKPSNIIACNGMAKIIDFSVSAKLNKPCRKGVGTKHYLAPEQARGGLVTEKTDVWGIGATLFQAAAGKRAFTSKKTGPKYPQLTDPAPALASMRDAPPAFADAIDSCLAYDPDDRPTIQELNEMLGTACSE